MALSGSHEEEVSWGAGTCPTKSPGNLDELSEAVLLFTEEPMVRAELGFMCS